MAETEFNFEGLAADWDQTESIRERLRRGRPLVQKHGSKPLPDSSIAESSLNSDLLAPTLVRLQAANGKLPDIAGLRECVATLFSKASRNAEDDEIDDSAWEIQKMMRFVKRKAGRMEVSQAPWL